MFGDDVILNGLLSHDINAQISLLARYGELIPFKLASDCRWLSPQDTEEIVSDVLREIIESPQTIDLDRGNGSMFGYIYRVSQRRALDLGRKLKSEGADSITLDLEPEELQRLPNPIAEEADGSSQTPEEVLVAARLAIGELKLSAAEHEHVRLRVEGKLEPGEIADYLGITPGNERTRWSRLRTRFIQQAQKQPALVAYGIELGVELSKSILERKIER